MMPYVQINQRVMNARLQLAETPDCRICFEEEAEGPGGKLLTP
jgi:hypothetical protein